MPKNKVLVSDKKTAYEEAKQEQTKQERMHSLQDLSSMFSSEIKSSDTYDLKNNPNSKTNNLLKIGAAKQPFATIQTSNSAYREMNRHLVRFYEVQKKDTVKQDQNQEVRELSTKLQDNESRKNTISEQMELMEKSYQLAAKYMPQGQNQAVLSGRESPIHSSNPESYPGTTINNSNKKNQIYPINQVSESLVSSLPQIISDTTFGTNRSKQSVRGFNTAVGISLLENKNTIKACVQENCTLANGQSVRLRLLEPIQVGAIFIPRNSIVSGEVNIQGDRLNILIQSLEYSGIIIPVKLTVYDTDGQKGIFIPGSMEINALKEMAANIGSSLGTSISITQSAGQQIASDLGKGIIQSGSQYLSKKFQQIKVKLKTDYQVLLFPSQD